MMIEEPKLERGIKKDRPRPMGYNSKRAMIGYMVASLVGPQRLETVPFASILKEVISLAIYDYHYGMGEVQEDAEKFLCGKNQKYLNLYCSWLGIDQEYFQEKIVRNLNLQEEMSREDAHKKVIAHNEEMRNNFGENY